jgi:hypothetical protein
VLREKLKIDGAVSRKVRNPDLLEEILGRPPINAKEWAKANRAVLLSAHKLNWFYMLLCIEKCFEIDELY